MSGGGSYYDALMSGYERGGSYVPCSHLRAVVSGEVRSCWITCVGLRQEVRRVGLRVGRFVEVGPQASKFVEAYVS